MLELTQRGLLTSRAETEWCARMQAAGARIPEGVTVSGLYRAVGGWMREELSYLCRMEEKGPRDLLISAEYLPGRLFEETARFLDVWNAVGDVAGRFGYSAAAVADREKEICTGNGTPGKCAVRILKKGWRDYPVTGYGLCYTEGWFRQRILDGEQVELPERWLEGHPLIAANGKEAVSVTFGGRVEEHFTETGMQVTYRDTERVTAVPYDVWLPGEGGRPCARLRLWRARGTASDVSPDCSQEEYLRRMRMRERQNAITGKLYPSDVGEEGRMLRLYQSYFLVSASLQDLRRHGGGGGEICLNGPSAALAIPEWMRIRMDEDGISWEEACGEVRRLFRGVRYERDEGLELDGEQVRLVLPRIFSILAEISRREPERHLWENGFFDLSALLLWALEEDRVFSCQEFGGLSPATWSRFGNGGFALWAERYLGKERQDESVLFRKTKNIPKENAGRELLQEKRRCKEALSSFLRARQERSPDPDRDWFVLTGSITGRHRALLSLLRMLYYREKAHGGEEIPSLCLVIGGKAAPDDALGKEILRFAWHLGWELQGDPLCRDFLQTVVAENCNTRVAELLLPAADVFEHLTLPGMGDVSVDVYAALSCGGLFLSTGGRTARLLAEKAGGTVLFGMSEKGVTQLWREGYRSIHYLRTDPTLRAAVSRLSRGIRGEAFPLLSDHLTRGGESVADPYLCLADLASYLCATESLARLLSTKEKRWGGMPCAMSGLSEWTRGYA